MKIGMTRRMRTMTLGAMVCSLALLTAPILTGQELGWEELYQGNAIMGLRFTQKVKDLDGKVVTVKGYMAPPLKAIGNFFVLTKDPVSLCPFCNSDADWPSDIMVIYLDRATTFIQNNRIIEVRGRLEIGSFTDPVTGFVSQLRLKEATFR